MRVAAYCRVSSDKDDQINSFANQRQYFNEYILSRPDWDLVKIYADEGISGTSTRKRQEFNNMIAAAKAGAIDLIITKEVSRFARNTVDTLKYTRELKSLGVYVIFMNDNINTADSDSELRLTIMASIAQEESRKTSERVKWGQKRRMEQGVVFGRDMLGYDVRGGRLYINEEGAEIVRLIFHKFLQEGKGTYTIARELEGAGIRTSSYMKNWSGTVILRILRNEKYCGDLVQKKTITPDYLSHKKKYNQGEEDLVILRDHHEAIVSREVFRAVQEELDRRSSVLGDKSKYSNRYCLSGKIECGLCHSRFVARSKRRADGMLYVAWRCYEATRRGLAKIDGNGNKAGCSLSRQIPDEYFIAMVRISLSGLKELKETILKELLEIVRPVILAEKEKDFEISSLAQRREQIELKKDRLLDVYLAHDISQAEYQRACKRYKEEIHNLEDREKAIAAWEESGHRETAIMGIADTFRGLLAGDITDDNFYRALVDKIIVCRLDHIELYFKGTASPWIFALP